MKKLFAIFSILLLSIIGCQEASTVVAPNESNTLEKQNLTRDYEISGQDTLYTFDNGKPALPRS